ncbi:hypothetical protein IW261DRAFT_1423666 [Armillaria novae-zelandiae]|uniref:Uncharacterized protein n=1 Tax=Armillaria novae-zelandiae TaxID=153914 RepID=A0AA39NX22_9AGAR|nr:hypothetical protein IW261DRAFT_1423666 [Armillaria novae-zelandiae]
MPHDGQHHRLEIANPVWCGGVYQGVARLAAPIFEFGIHLSSFSFVPRDYPEALPFVAFPVDTTWGFAPRLEFSGCGFAGMGVFGDYATYGATLCSSRGYSVPFVGSRTLIMELAHYTTRVNAVELDVGTIPTMIISITSLQTIEMIIGSPDVCILGDEDSWLATQQQAPDATVTSHPQHALNTFPIESEKEGAGVGRGWCKVMSALPLDKEELRSIDARLMLHPSGATISRRADYDWWGHIYVRPGGSTRAGGLLQAGIVPQCASAMTGKKAGSAGTSERGADREQLLPESTTSIERTGRVTDAPYLYLQEIDCVGTELGTGQWPGHLHPASPRYPVHIVWIWDWNRDMKLGEHALAEVYDRSREIER